MYSSRIYTYKITFEEVPYYYYGSRKEKKYNEYYMGSPVTHKWCWELYTPKKQILELFDYTNEGYEECRRVENRLIKPFLDDPYCLNKNCGGIVSTEMCKKGAKTQVENKIGIHSRTREQIIKDGNKGRETQKKMGIGIYGLSPEIRKENGKRLGQRNVETGHIQKLGKEYGKLCSENGLGLFGMDGGERNEARSRGGKTSGNNAYKNKTGIHAFTKEEKQEIGRKSGRKNVETGHIKNLGETYSKQLNSKLWKCLVTGYITTSGPLTNYQRSRGIDTDLRVQIDYK
jgi:hypothetical protein